MRRRTRPRIRLPRLLQGIAVAVVATLAFSSVSTQQASAIFNSENPSGKTRRDGSPLVTPFSLNDADRHMRHKGHKHKHEPRKAGAECPRTIKCVVLPAAYQQNGNDVGNYGNYDKANRPHDMKINSIVLHDTEGSLESVLEAFQNPQFYASSHYVIDKDGTVYQMVKNKDVAWHAGNWWYNMHSIGIEHVGYAHNGSTDYTPEMYKASTELVKYLSRKYDIPYDRGHILGHDNVPAPRSDLVAGMHTDPGPYWNWSEFGKRHYFDWWKKHNKNYKKHDTYRSKAVTIRPDWDTNKRPVTGCTMDDQCVPDVAQPTNFAYLHTDTDVNSPLISDPVLGQGTTDIKNNAARVVYGQTYAVADTKFTSDGAWYKLWVNGKTGWLWSPWKLPIAYPAHKSKFVTPKEGSGEVPVYGRAVPNSEEYPDDFVPPAGAIPSPTPLPYTMKQGDRYKILDKHVPTDHYYAWTIDKSMPYDHTVFKGSDDYYLVQFGNRVAFVKKADVDVRR